MELGFVSVAVIDDGINENLYEISNLKNNLEILDDLSIIHRNNYDTYQQSHGTTCAAIIKKYTKFVEFSSLKILNNKTKKAKKEQLIKAIEWCSNNNIDIVNISLGTIDFRDFEDIKKCINEASIKGLIMVAACNNKNIFTYPACCSNVIGVICDNRYSNDKYKYIKHPIDGIDIIASSNHFLIDVFGISTNTNLTNSYATPMITATVCNILNKSKKMNLESIKKKLSQNAINPINPSYNPYLYVRTDWVYNAIIVYIGFNISTRYIYLPYYNIVETLFIDLASFGETNFIERIFNGLNDNEKKFKHIDTAILFLDNKLLGYTNWVLPLMKFFENQNINMLFIYNPDFFSNNMIELNQVKVKVWDPKAYNNLINNQSEEYYSIDIPIIVLYSKDTEKLLYTLWKLNNLFRLYGYYSIGITNIFKANGYYLEYLPIKNINKEKFISKIINKYLCDLVLVGILEKGGDHNNFFNHNFSDLHIEIKSEEIIVFDHSNTISVLKYKNEISEKNCEEIYKIIINYFIR